MSSWSLRSSERDRPLSNNHTKNPSVNLTPAQVPHFIVAEVRKSFHEKTSLEVKHEAHVDINQKEKAKWHRHQELQVQRPCGWKSHEEDVGRKGSQHDWDGGQDENAEGWRNQTEQSP